MERLLEQLGVAGLDPLAVDEDPALVADEAVAVLAVAGRDQVGAVGVRVGHGEMRVAVVAVGLVEGFTPVAVTLTGPEPSMPRPHCAMSLWWAPQSVSLPPLYSYHQRNS